MLTRIVAAFVALVVVPGVRTLSRPLLGSTAGPDRVGYVYRHPWGCASEVWVGDGPYGVRQVTPITPFACDDRVPRMELGGREIALVDERGAGVGSWNFE